MRVMSNEAKLIAGLTQAWRDEMASARNYRALAEREKDPHRQGILQRLAEAEEKHASNWQARLKELGADPGTYTESAADRARRWLLVQSGTESAVVKLEAMENEADQLYGQLLAVATDRDRQQISEAQREEEAHAKVLSEITEAFGPTQRKLDRLLKAERWHVTSGSWIGQAVYGANDGLGGAFGVVSGVAGATDANAQWVLLSGIAAAVASALSMGSGAYLATKSEREVYEAELDRERKEIEQNPAEEREEMELFYQLKGFSAEESKTMAAKLAESPDHLLKTLAHEELGLSERSFPNPWRAAISATLSTAAGAFIPVIPYFWMTGMTALVWSFVISTLAHFLVGAAKVFVTGRSWFKSGMEMTLVGVGAAIITYLVGHLIAPVLN
jgi:VIT1/CCC1 family predicted Fe2+/Mn2+ transporter/rubrerythrin